SRGRARPRHHHPRPPPRRAGEAPREHPAARHHTSAAHHGDRGCALRRLAAPGRRLRGRGAAGRRETVTPESAYDEIHARLRRWPDIETHDLVAADQSDRLILAAAGELPADVTIVGDRYGAIALSILAAAPDTRIRLHQDPVTGERALAANAEDLGISLDTLSWHGLDETLTRGATLVVGQLPRGLGALDEIAGVIADHADPAVRVGLGGRQKHMTTSMNDVLRTHFDDMHVGRGVGKSRTLHATAPKKGSGEPWPRRAEHDGLTLVAHGAAFAGTDLDVGTRFLLTFLDRMPRTADAIDLGCG